MLLSGMVDPLLERANRALADAKCLQAGYTCQIEKLIQAMAHAEQSKVDLQALREQVGQFTRMQRDCGVLPEHVVMKLKSLFVDTDFISGSRARYDIEDFVVTEGIHAFFAAA